MFNNKKKFSLSSLATKFIQSDVHGKNDFWMTSMANKFIYKHSPIADLRKLSVSRFSYFEKKYFKNKFT